MPKISNNANVFARNRAALENAADKLDAGAQKAIKDARQDVKDAGDHGAMAMGHVVAAGAHAIAATGDVLDGVASTFEAGGDVAAAGGYGALGALGWAAEGVSMAGRFVAKNVAAGFAKLANLFTGVLKDGKTVTVNQLEGDPNAVRFSDEMFGKAAGKLNDSSAAMNAAWNSYGQALDHALMSGVHVTMAAGHTAAVAGNLAKAAAEVGEAGALKLAEFGVEVAAVANNLAEDATVEARDAMILSAKVSAAVANRLAVAGQGEVKVTVDQQIADFKAELEQLQAGA